MKHYLFLTLLTLATCAAIFIAPIAYAEADMVCARRVAEDCFAKEKDKPDDTRSGMSAAEYCSAKAVIECDR